MGASIGRCRVLSAHARRADRWYAGVLQSLARYIRHVRRTWALVRNARSLFPSRLWLDEPRGAQSGACRDLEGLARLVLCPLPRAAGEGWGGGSAIAPILSFPRCAGEGTQRD